MLWLHGRLVLGLQEGLVLRLQGRLVLAAGCNDDTGRLSNGIQGRRLVLRLGS